MPTQSEFFADFACDFRVSVAPEEIVSYTRLLVLDLIGCAIGGLNGPEANSSFTACLALDQGQGSASLWGTGRKASARTAALFNGIISHVLELDDFMGIDHTGAVVVPAMLAVMQEMNDLTEDRLLESMILSYEIGRRMLDAGGGYNKHNSVGWHTTGTLGSYAAAVAVGKFLRLNREQMVSAIGLAGSFTGGTWAFNSDGTMSKRFHPGKAADAGITAAYMAQAGFTGPSQIMEAEWGGYFPLYAPNHNYDLTELFANLGHDLRIGWTGIKPYACCRGNHSSIDAIFKIRAQAEFTAAEVSGVDVRCSHSQFRQLGNTDPATVVEAQLSLPYAVATAIRFDDVGLNRFSEDALNDSQTRVLSKKIVCEPTDEWLPGVEPLVTVRLSDGRQFSEQVPIALGDPRNPVTTAAVVDKFKSLTERALAKDQQEIIIEFGLSQSPQNDINGLLNVLASDLRAIP